MRAGAVIVTLLQIMLLFSCKSKVALDEEDFTKVLIRLHVTDAVLKNAGLIGKEGMDDDQVYSYYVGIFKDYGIDKNTFDSCLSYYSRNTEEFLRIYSVVIDSLNMRLTKVNKKLSFLKADDTLNLLTLSSPFYLSLYDTSTIFEFAGVKEGIYSFSMKFKADSLRKDHDSKIESYFLRDRYLDTVYRMDSVWYTTRFVRMDSVFSLASVMDPSTDSVIPVLYRTDSVFSYERHCNSFEVRERRCLSDTFKLRTMTLYPDTNLRYYSWREYVDSSFNRLCVRYVRNGKGDENVGDAVLEDVRLNRLYETPEENKLSVKTFMERFRRNFYRASSSTLVKRTSSLTGQQK